MQRRAIGKSGGAGMLTGSVSKYSTRTYTPLPPPPPLNLTSPLPHVLSVTQCWLVGTVLSFVSCVFFLPRCWCRRRLSFS